MNIDVVHNFQDLPLDIVLTICNYLDNYLHIIYISKTSKYLKQILNHVKTIQKPLRGKAHNLKLIHDKKICMLHNRIVYPHIKSNEVFSFQIGNKENPMILQSYDHLFAECRIPSDAHSFLNQNWLFKLDRITTLMLRNFLTSIRCNSNQKFQRYAYANDFEENMLWITLPTNKWMNRYDCNIHHETNYGIQSSFPETHTLKNKGCSCIVQVIFEPLRFIAHEIFIFSDTQ
tara:strand:- start:413 stop:1105 length:693 start_codon:yes stop_codon:yes gene_type:complete